MEVRGDVSGAAAQVGDPAVRPAGPYLLREDVQHRPVQRPVTQGVAEQLGVRGRGGVVRLAGDPEGGVG